jgi:hypothetical protein
VARPEAVVRAGGLSRRRGQPGPEASSISSFNNSRIPERKMATVCVPQTSIIRGR